ncbi:MAG: hypothetical protein E6Q58_04380 [Niabella sp.]|nr:MAG: hypothetical protein E6Q58_04380 [Niabella sp.]
MIISKKSIGVSAENAVSKYFQSKGFKIISQNYNVPRIGELDLVCKDLDLLVYFIEVRYRSRIYKDSEVDQLDLESIFSNFKRSKFIKISRLFAFDHNINFEKAKKLLVIVTTFVSCMVISKVFDIETGEEILMF